MATFAALLQGRRPGIPACLDLCDCIMIEAAVGCSEVQQQRARRKTATWGFRCQQRKVPKSEGTPVNWRVRQSRASSRDGFCLKIESITTRRKRKAPGSCSAPTKRLLRTATFSCKPQQHAQTKDTTASWSHHLSSRSICTHFAVRRVRGTSQTP